MSHKLGRFVLPVFAFTMFALSHASAATLKVNLTKADAAFPPSCGKILDQFSDFKRASGSVFFGDVEDVQVNGENQFSFAFDATLLRCSEVARGQFAWQSVAYYDTVDFNSASGQMSKVILEKRFIFQTPAPHVIANTKIDSGAGSVARVTANIDLTQALTESELAALNEGAKIHLMIQALPWGWAQVFRNGEKSGILRGTGHPLVIEFDLQKQD